MIKPLGLSQKCHRSVLSHALTLMKIRHNHV